MSNFPNQAPNGGISTEGTPTNMNGGMDAAFPAAPAMAQNAETSKTLW